MPSRSVWLLYGGGEDSQPFPDLPTTARYPDDSINSQLAKYRSPLILPTAPAKAAALAEPVGVGHMYNLAVPVHLPSQADAIFFIPRDHAAASMTMNERPSKRIVGYADPLSVLRGRHAPAVHQLRGAGPFQAALVRVVSGDARPHGTGFREVAIDASFAGTHAGQYQAVVPGSYAVLPGLPASRALTFACCFLPTLLEAAPQTLATGGGFAVAVSTAGIGIRLNGRGIAVPASLQPHRWHTLVVCVGAELVVHVECQPRGPAEARAAFEFRQPIESAAFLAGTWELARERSGHGHFNGRIEAVRIYGTDVGAAAARIDLDLPRPSRPGLNGAWDFSIGIETGTVTDVSGHNRHGSLQQMPTRAVRGMKWRGNTFNWRDDPSQYAAIHFHDDDLADAHWRPTIRWQVPDTLPSGVYAAKLTLGDSEDYIPFFVRPAAHHRRADVALLASTATYIAYANQRLAFVDGIYVERKPRTVDDAYLLAHPELGGSLYDHHRDGSGVHYSSRRRPVLNLKPKGIPWSFTADTNLTAWLEHIGTPFDVITDEDLHRDGAAALRGYSVVITGTHPEYHSTPMLDALTEWLAAGGRMMYMGGNGFYWRIAYCPEDPAIIEVRRAEDGTRAWIAEPGEYYHAFTGEYGGLWRRIGRPPIHSLASASLHKASTAARTTASLPPPPMRAPRS